MFYQSKLLKTFVIVLLLSIASYNLSCRSKQVQMSVKKYDLYSLDDFKDPRNIPKILKALNDKDPYVRIYAVRALGEFGDKSLVALPKLIAMLDDPNDGVKGNCLAVISKFPKNATAATSKIIQMTNSRNPGVRQNALLALEKIYKYEREETKRSIYKAIELAAEYDTNLRVRRYATNTLKNIYLQRLSNYSALNNSELRGSGSGFLLSESGLIATNFHVIKNANMLKVNFPKLNLKFTASILLQDKNNDLAVLKCINFDYDKNFHKDIPFTIPSAFKIQLGEDVFTLGYPLDEILGSEVKVSRGTVNSKGQAKSYPTIFQISNPIQPGNSGGPLFNKKGELIGIIVSALNAKHFLIRDGFVPQNVNFAIKVNYLNNLLEMLPEAKEIYSRQNLLSELSLENQIKQLEQFIVKVEHYN